MQKKALAFGLAAIMALTPQAGTLALAEEFYAGSPESQGLDDLADPFSEAFLDLAADWETGQGDLFFEVDEAEPQSLSFPVGAASIQVSEGDWVAEGGSYKLKKAASPVALTGSAGGQEEEERVSLSQAYTGSALPEGEESFTGSFDFGDFSDGEPQKEEAVFSETAQLFLQPVGDQEELFVSEVIFTDGDGFQETPQEEYQEEFQEEFQEEALWQTIENPDQEPFGEGFSDLPLEDNTQEEPEAEVFSGEAAPVAAVQEVEEEALIPVGASTSSYYTSADGVLSITTSTASGKSHTGTYLFDANGLMVTGLQTVGSVSYYFRKAGEASLDSWEDASAAKKPYNSTFGNALKKTWRWVSGQGLFQYYGSAGQQQAISDLEASQKSAGTYKGYFQIQGNYYCLNSKGKPQTGTVVLNSATYYFSPQEDEKGIPGAMFHDGWLGDTGKKGERWRYFYSTKKKLGQMKTHGIVATKIPAKGSGIYLLDKDGYLLKSKMRQASNGKYYHTDKTGQVLTDKVARYKGQSYYYGKNGARVKWVNSWHRCDGYYYYFGSTPGQIQKMSGWQKVTTSSGRLVGWFFFQKNGKHAVNKWMSGHARYATETGALASGLTKIGDKMYFFARNQENAAYNRLVKSSLFRYGGNYYYAASNGVLKESGWLYYNNSAYYFRDYKAVCNEFIKNDSGIYGYLDNQGRFWYGWYVVNDSKNQVKYISEEAGGFAANTSLVIDGLTYFFDSNGLRINDVSDRVSGPYYVEVDRVNGIATVYNAAKTIPVRSIRVSVGAAGTETPLGTYSLTPYGRWVTLMGPSYGQYGTHVVNGILFHSIPMNSPSLHGVPSSAYYKLGSPASHGCIRCCVADAKFIYEKCGGATVRIFDGTPSSYEVFRGPLGKNPIVPMTGDYDPTDPAV